MTEFKLIPLVIVVLLGFAGCCGSDSTDPLDELTIDREEAAQESPVIEHEDGTVTRKFLVDQKTYQSLAFQSGDRDAAPDPFAAPAASEPLSGATWPARKILEGFDIPFPEDSERKAAYDLKAGILTVRHTPEWVDFVQIILESLEPRERTINLRIEIYEVPKALALRLEQGAGEHSDHGPEWKALQEIVRAGDATFVTSCNIRGQSGQRASYRDGAEYVAFDGFEWDTTVEPPAPKPRFDTRLVGTVVEMDPVLSADNQTMDFNLGLEHHTAPPTMAPLEVPVPGQEEPAVIDAPVFHAKELTTLVTILDGGTMLLCSWRPTGLPEFEEQDLMRIAFLRADVQKLAGD